MSTPPVDAPTTIDPTPPGDIPPNGEPTATTSAGKKKLWPGLHREMKKAGPWAGRDAAGTKAFMAVLLVAVLCGPIAIVVVALRPAAPAVAPVVTAGPDGSTDHDRQLAIGTASSFLITWLSATGEEQNQITGRLLYPPEQIVLPSKRPAAAQVSVHSVVRGLSGEWVVVAESTAAGDTAWWQLNVVVQAGSAAVMTLPAQIAAPRMVGEWAVSPGPADMRQVARDHPAAAAADGFARSLLAGGGDINRWVAPGVDVNAISPAPCAATTSVFASASELSVAPSTSERGRGVLSVVCVDSAKQPFRSMQYVLELAGRDGRWEITGHSTVSDPTATTPPSADPSNSPSPSSVPSASSSNR